MGVAIHPSKGNRSFLYGNERILFERIERKANAPRLRIKVHPDCRVVVQAPANAPDDEVIKALKKRARWVYTKLRDFRAQLQHIQPRQYISGESHYYLGKQHVLKVLELPKEKAHVKLLRGKLEVTLAKKSPLKIKQLLNAWYTERAKEVFAKRLDSLLESALWVNERPPMRVFSMKTQWGSCSPNGRLTLNPYLVKAPTRCIDYVILHELCHIAEHNHSEKFYRLLTQVMPDWEKVKDRLDGMAAVLLNDV